MDSLTQIILGAACGEIALGKKIGNKALLFGAIGGTIPDLDVFIGPLLYKSELDAMIFHRGFMHSIVFSILGAFLFGWLTYKIYEKLKLVRFVRSFFSLFNVFWLTRFVYRFFDKYSKEPITLIKSWIWLFFLSLFTHPILDAFTGYGTQLFLPFSNYRVAFSNISVVDLKYTVPFLICIIVMMCFKRNTKKRSLWLKLSIGISSVYMLFTIANKFYMNSVFEKSFKEANISYTRYSTQPTILNNFLWYSIAETKTDYHVCFYSLFDSSDRAENIMKIPKHQDVIDTNHPDIQKLIWFSNNFFNFKKEGDIVTYVDMRYPLLKADDPNSALFTFDLIKDSERWDITPFEGKPPKEVDFQQFWERLKGK